VPAQHLAPAVHDVPCFSGYAPGEESQLWRDSLRAGDLSWVSGEAPQQQIDVTAKIRYRAAEVAAAIRIHDGTAEVIIHQPQKAIAPGQAVVFYRSDAVLGGGIIIDNEVV